MDATIMQALQESALNPGASLHILCVCNYVLKVSVWCYRYKAHEFFYVWLGFTEANRVAFMAHLVVLKEDLKEKIYKSL
jgi:hypothetical protein